jgi:hypothetical protein
VTNHKKPPLVFIRELCAGLTEEEINEAEERFWRYLEIVRRIAIHIEQKKNSPPKDTPPRFDKSEI